MKFYQMTGRFFGWED
ncbi:hypothetical protein EYF80_062343 [Liparis tanakae]|nr:hypothetical protein EYF80_062343 [Liparis tanakae]